MGHSKTCRALLALVCASAWACTDKNIHDTNQVQGHACIECHSAAFNGAQNPVHVAVDGGTGFPTTCGDCHSTKAWVPAAGGHPEDKFPIQTGSHHNAAIGCGDCHIASLGESAAGANTDCIHCHIGAHTDSVVDAIHDTPASVDAGYTPVDPTKPHSCLSCHPSG